MLSSGSLQKVENHFSGSFNIEALIDRRTPEAKLAEYEAAAQIAKQPMPAAPSASQGAASTAPPPAKMQKTTTEPGIDGTAMDLCWTGGG